MAERKGPWDHETGRDPVESDGQDDRSQVAEQGELSGAETANDESVAETQEETPTAKVVPLIPRSDSSDETDTDFLDSDELVELEDVQDLIDLSELQADDALLDALGGTDPSVPERSGQVGPSLEMLLVAWRREVDAAPVGDLVDVETAAAAIAEGKPKRGLRRWHLVPVASAAAVLMIACTGVGVAARDALPGDMLWGVAQVLYSDHARAAQAEEDAKIALERARQALDQGQLDQAEDLLNSAEDHMQDVDAEHGLNHLQAAHESLAAEFSKPAEPPTSSSSVVSSEPPPSDSSEVFPPSTDTSVPSTSETETSSPSTTPEPTDSTSPPSTSDTSPSMGTSDTGTGGFLAPN